MERNKYSFNFDDSLIDDSIKYVKNSIAHSEGVNSKIDKLISLAAKVSVSGLDLSASDNVKKTITDLEMLDSEIIKWKNEGLSAMAEFPDFQYSLVEWIKNGNISAVDVVSVAGIYLRDLVEKDPDYYTKFKEATSVQGVLREQGFSEEFIDSLSSAFCENLI